MRYNNNIFFVICNQLGITFNLSLFTGRYHDFEIFTLITPIGWRPSWKYANLKVKTRSKVTALNQK